MAMTLMLPAALLLAGWARISLRWAAGRGVDAGLLGTALSALIGYFGVLLSLAAGPGAASPETELALCVFGALLLVAAWTDHRTAWAPDGVILPLLSFGAVAVSLIGPLGVGPGGAIGIALLIFGVAQAAWAAQALTGWRVLPPPDLIALSLPILLFGLTPYAFLTYLALSLTLLLALKAPEPVYRLIRGPAAAEAVKAANLTGAGRSAPLLPMALGALYGVLLLRLFQG